MTVTNPSAWLRHELPQRLRLEQIATDFSYDSDFYSEDTNLSTATCRAQVRKWSELQSVHKPGWSLSHEDDEPLAQQIVHQQSAEFTFKIIYRDAWGRNHTGNRRGLSPPKLPCLKLRAHCLDSIVRGLGPIAKHRIFTIPQTAWAAFGVPECRFCTDPENTPAYSEPGFKASHSRKRKDMMTKIEALGADKRAFATTHSVGFSRGQFRMGDSIWALYGSDIPFILREVDDDYELVGDCYLHGTGRPFPCQHCGADGAPWPMQTEIIDIW